jgi:hypothetical protein
MIKLNKIEGYIDFVFNHIKDSIIDDKIKFSRIEKYSFEKKIQWLLSIVLIKSYTEEEIDEIVLEANLIIDENRDKISMDLSYGNGIILKENSVLIQKEIGVCKEEMLKYLETHLFNNTDSEILTALSAITSDDVPSTN